jgi:hypothetical protein
LVCRFADFFLVDAVRNISNNSNDLSRADTLDRTVHQLELFPDQSDFDHYGFYRVLLLEIVCLVCLYGIFGFEFRKPIDRKLDCLVVLSRGFGIVIENNFQATALYHSDWNLLSKTPAPVCVNPGFCCCETQRLFHQCETGCCWCGYGRAKAILPQMRMSAAAGKPVLQQMRGTDKQRVTSSLYKKWKNPLIPDNAMFLYRLLFYRITDVPRLHRDLAAKQIQKRLRFFCRDRAAPVPSAKRRFR